MFHLIKKINVSIKHLILHILKIVFGQYVHASLVRPLSVSEPGKLTPRDVRGEYAYQPMEVNLCKPPSPLTVIHKSRQGYKI